MCKKRYSSFFWQPTSLSTDVSKFYIIGQFALRTIKLEHQRKVVCLLRTLVGISRQRAWSFMIAMIQNPHDVAISALGAEEIELVCIRGACQLTAGYSI